MLQFLHEQCKAVSYAGQEVLYIQPKYDGHRVTAISQPKTCDLPMALYTRSQTNLFLDMAAKAKEHNIWPWIANLMRMPRRSSIDGELCVHGKPASYIKTAIKECDPSLKFLAFAAPWWSGKRKYTEPLEAAMDRCTAIDIEFIDFIKLDEVQAVDSELWLNRIKPDVEGWVLKKFHYSHWYKLKKVHTIDLVVTSLTEGKGKYEGFIGGLRCSAYDNLEALQEICVCSGMDDDTRKGITPVDIGRVCEVKYQEAASLGRLRHPIFVRWRDDKSPQECTMAQDLTLLRYWSKADA